MSQFCATLMGTVAVPLCLLFDTFFTIPISYSNSHVVPKLARPLTLDNILYTPSKNFHYPVILGCTVLLQSSIGAFQAVVQKKLAARTGSFCFWPIEITLVKKIVNTKVETLISSAAVLSLHFFPF